MAEIITETVYLEIKNSIIIGIHSDDIDMSNLPEGHTIQMEDIEEPNSILGLNVSYIPLPVMDRPTVDEASEIDLKRGELKQVSVELDLAVRLGEDTTDLDAQFLILKDEYDVLKPK